MVSKKPLIPSIFSTFGANIIKRMRDHSNIKLK